MSLSKEQKNSIITENGGSKTNTGSVETQVALLTADIKAITEHMKNAPKDFSTKRGLYKKVSQRRSLLIYLKDQDIVRYRDIVKKLDLRS